MSTWAELRAEVRLELKDTGTTYKWSDAELLVYCNDALRGHSTYWPLVVITEVTTTGAGYPVPTGTIDVLAV